MDNRLFFLKKNLFFSVFLFFLNQAYGQVGFNNPNPDKFSIIDVYSSPGNPKGLLIPRISTDEREALGVAIIGDPDPLKSESLLVYDTDLDMFFAFVNEVWCPLNPWVMKGEPGVSNIHIATTGNVGIGVAPSSGQKLEVNGAIKSTGLTTGNVTSSGTISASSLTTSGNISSSGSISSSSLTTSGNITSSGVVSAVSFSGDGIVPSGAIIMWSGTSIPDGWALCDGTNGTPDLKGRFIVGYDPSDTDYNNPGNRSTGGVSQGDRNTAKKTHTLTESQMPKHSHSFAIAEFRSDQTESGTSGGGYEVGSGYTTINTSEEGSGTAFDIRPSYYTLAFIMKL